MLLPVWSIADSNMTSFFRFVDKRVIYRWYNLIRTCPGECDWLFHWQYKLCATFSANININDRLPIKLYYSICTLRHIRNRNKSWKPECFLSFNVDWRILVNFIGQSMLKLPTHSGFHDLFLKYTICQFSTWFYNYTRYHCFARPLVLA
jgi:hypothetical protein